MITPTLNLEKKLWKSGYSYICGLDEVGRGSFAGPVCVGAVIFPKDLQLQMHTPGVSTQIHSWSGIDEIADSKLLKPRIREKLAEVIKDQTLTWAVSEVSVSVINRVGIGKATQMAFRKAIKLLSKAPDFVLIDAFYIKHFNRKNQKAVKDGDKICVSISAASIIAKVYRDKLMKKLHKKYPNYGFAKHKGYGTKRHQQALRIHGLSRIHRRSFNLSKFL